MSTEIPTLYLTNFSSAVAINVVSSISPQLLYQKVNYVCPTLS